MSESLGEALRDDQYVVRGGARFSLGVIQKSAESARKRFGVPGISVRFAAEVDEAGDELLAAVCLPHGTVRVAVVGALRQAGYDVRQTGGVRHATLIFADTPVEEDCEALEEIF